MQPHLTPDQLPRPHLQPEQGWTPPAVSLTALLDLLEALEAEIATLPPMSAVRGGGGTPGVPDEAAGPEL